MRISNLSLWFVNGKFIRDVRERSSGGIQNIGKPLRGKLRLTLRKDYS